MQYHPAAIDAIVAALQIQYGGWLSIMAAAMFSDRLNTGNGVTDYARISIISHRKLLLPAYYHQLHLHQNWRNRGCGAKKTRQ